MHEAEMRLKNLAKEMWRNGKQARKLLRSGRGSEPLVKKINPEICQTSNKAYSLQIFCLGMALNR
jgi:hypothetical protein